ncbi:MAG: hypothetical protein Q8P25_01225 [Candidatus Curtissbacteria bacterium]|nr:hypothetical protein [Candidatus Curtissbacteria bacterium]
MKKLIILAVSIVLTFTACAFGNTTKLPTPNQITTPAVSSNNLKTYFPTELFPKTKLFSSETRFALEKAGYTILPLLEGAGAEQEMKGLDIHLVGTDRAIVELDGKFTPSAARRSEVAVNLSNLDKNLMNYKGGCTEEFKGDFVGKITRCMDKWSKEKVGKIPGVKGVLPTVEDVLVLNYRVLNRYGFYFVDKLRHGLLAISANGQPYQVDPLSIVIDLKSDEYKPRIIIREAYSARFWDSADMWDPHLEIHFDEIMPFLVPTEVNAQPI